ncbi:MAG: hypothetical protein QOF89_5498 [Acidobacteriota bacterium]|jgi:hypothetical protein|nr:hypothetical protein [Acidobacteriota bacterium]
MFNRLKAALAMAALGSLLGVTVPRHAEAEDITIPLKGEYTKIDIRLATETMQALAKGTSEEKRKAIESVKASPDRYAPPVFYLLSNVLFEDGKQEEAAFWFYAGQLRARFDANRCADISAREAVSVLNDQYGPPINQFMLQHRLVKLEELIPQVVEWDRKTPHNYDHRWINLHGMDAALAGLDVDGSDGKPEALSLPEKQWGEIAEKTRRDYLADFREVLAQLKSQKK